MTRVDPDAPIHASAVAWDGQGVLILGPSGSGKSAVALSLMAFGARLIADDRVILSLKDGRPWLSAPDSIRNVIEARGVGLLNADAQKGGELALVIDLSQVETARLPEERHLDCLGHPIPLVHKVESAHFVPAIVQYLKSGRSDL
jgi:HPr kinase/phosphorylase